MRNVSEQFLHNIEQGTVALSYSATITLANSDVLEVDGTHLLLKDNAITCNPSSNVFPFGATIGKTATVALFNIDGIYTGLNFRNAKIELRGTMEIDGEDEVLKLGKYHVDDSEVTGVVITLTCFDKMTELDKVYTHNIDYPCYLKDAIADYMSIIGCEFDGLDDILNGEYIIRNSPLEVVSSTYTGRQFMSDCAMLSGSNCLVDYATDNFKFVHYTQETDDTKYWELDKFINLNFDTDSITIDGLSIVVDKKEYKVLTPPKLEKYVFALENPLVIDTPQLWLESIKDRILGLTILPFTGEHVNNLLVEIGDWCHIIDMDGIPHTSIITMSDHTIAGSSSFGCRAETELSNRSSYIDRTADKIEKELERKDIAVTSTTNVELLRVSNKKEVIVLELTFGANEEIKPIFMCTIPFIMNLDGNVIFRYYIDAVLVETDTITGYYERGYNVQSLTNVINITTSSLKTLHVTMQTEYFESDNRQEKAKVISLQEYVRTGSLPSPVVDTTPPSLEIPQYGISACVFAQGLGVTKWDGTLVFNEYVKPIRLDDIPSISVVHATDRVVVDAQVPTGGNFVERVRPIQLSDIPEIRVASAKDVLIAGAGDIITTTLNVLTYGADVEIKDNKYVIVDGGSTPQTLMSKDFVKTSDITGLSSCSIVGDDTTLYAFSFDSGATWKIYNNEWLTVTSASAGMTRSDVNSISTSAFNEQFTDKWRIRAIMVDGDAFITSINMIYLNT